MLGLVARKVLGTKNDRLLRSMRPLVARVNEFENALKALGDQELAGQTTKFKERLERGEPLDALMPEAFATVREVARRTLNMRHFDVQIIGGSVLHSGRIAEMKTGEGKTLVATLPVYLNALTGKGVHVVTVNDYLANRDAEWMGTIYKFLGMSVGVIVPQLDPNSRKEAYGCDITYGQNNEFGFDYLRDNMKFELEDMAQRSHSFAIVDEVDSILIDEARTPLIISGPAEDATDKYATVNKIIPRLAKDADFEVDPKSKSPALTEEGVAHAEKLLGVDNLFDPSHSGLLHHLNQALKAHHMLQRDVDYVVRDNQVIIVDEFTGRMMAGRRWSDGLHQAVEAKEGLKIARENQTLATITFQNYFRMYDKLAGMTGTADTEAVEFKKIYNLEVVVIPTNKSMIRKDNGDLVFKSRKEKYDAAVKDIAAIHETGQPILVGTISIEQSEDLSKVLRSQNVPHSVLNAKQHEREAEIVSQAGRLGAVTISTNMAGRGTDIVLGGNPESLAASEAGTRDRSDPAFTAALEKYKRQCAEERQQVLDAGGLHIIGTERHESRRIDNQLRGRSGRQGDPGSSQFYVSLEDDLMRRFGGERVQRLMELFRLEEGVTLEGRMITRSIENAQRRVEGHHFDIRKHLLEYDDVMNKQRQVIYAERLQVLRQENLESKILEMADDLMEEVLLETIEEQSGKKDPVYDRINQRLAQLCGEKVVFESTDGKVDPQKAFDLVREALKRAYKLQAARIGEEQFREIESHIYLEALDYFWKNHLLEMDHLKEGIGLRGYGQKNPLHEYQKEGFLLFQQMIANIKENVVRKMFAIRPLTEAELKAIEDAERARREAQEKQISLIHSNQPQSEPVDASEQAASKDPDAERERLKAQKRERRKSAKR